MPLEPLNPTSAATAAPMLPSEPADTQAIVRRLDGLFRNAPPTPAMQQLRDIVQRYRLGALP